MTDQIKDDRVDQAGETRSARLESLRALAACGVLVFHVFEQSHRGHLTGPFDSAERLILSGSQAVWLFFALSGFLLFLPFARRDLRGGGPVDLRRYATNRALRILPLYYVVLIVVLSVGKLGDAEQWWRFGLFLENFSTRTVAGGSETAVGTMWTLVIELHFYVLLPILAAAFSWLARGSAPRMALLVAISGTASLLLAAWADSDPGRVLWLRSLPGTFFFFAIGMLLAVWRVARERTSYPTDAHAAALIGVSIGLWVWVSESGAMSETARRLIYGLSALTLLTACTLPVDRSRIARALEWRPLVAVGLASYSLYLWHLPIVGRLARSPDVPHGFGALLAVAVPMTLIVALVSFRWIETPFLRLRRGWVNRGGLAPGSRSGASRSATHAEPSPTSDAT